MNSPSLTCFGRRIWLAGLLCTGACGPATDADPPTGLATTDAAEPNPAVTRITAEALRRGQAYEILTELCETAPSRLSGSPGAQAAVAWAEETMRSLGLSGVHAEPCEVPVWIRGEVEELTVLEPADWKGGELSILALGNSIATPPEGLEAELLVVRSFEELAALGAEARDKAVLFARAMDPGEVDPFNAYGGAANQRSRGASEASRAGASFALVRSLSGSTNDFPHTGQMNYEDGVEPIPAAAISTRACDLLVARIESGETVRVRLKLDCRNAADGPSANVIGEWVGRETPEEIVVISAHLDAWDVGQGAHDDGAGVAHVLEAVRLLNVLDLRPRRTIRVVLYMNEENGIRGALDYAQDHADELDRHVLAFESDRGGFSPRGFRFDGGPAGLSYLRQLNLPLASLGCERIDAGFAGVDISPLKAHGVPLVGLYPDPQRYFDFHHSAADTLEAVNPRELQLGAAAVASLAYLAAEAEDLCPRTPAQ